MHTTFTRRRKNRILNENLKKIIDAKDNQSIWCNQGKKIYK